MSNPEASSPIDRLSPEQQERLAAVLDDYLSDREHDLPPDVEQILAAHPDLQEALRASFRSLEFLDRATNQLITQPDNAAPEETSRSSSEKRLGDFNLIREVGRGGMGIVYEARQISLDRRVALKVLPFAAVLDQKQIARFENEARAAAQLHHPNIVPVYSVGCERGVHYYAMQYVEGNSLDRALTQIKALASEQVRSNGTEPTTRTADAESADRSTLRGFTTAESSHGRDYYRAVCRFGIQAAEALQHAHDCGIVHRDVKPSNLLLDGDGKLWVTDFGLARFQASDASLTLTGQVLGSLRYMSPEQAAGKSNLLDQRSDVYSLGVTLYEAAALEPAFEGDERAELLRRIADEEPRSPRRVRPSIPADLENIIVKAISKAPEQRYETAQELADDLRRFLDGKPTLARRPSWTDRAGKWTRRHAKLVAAAACVAIAATIGLTASTLMIAAAHTRTKTALEDSEKNRGRAEDHYRQAREVVDRFGARLAEQLAEIPGAEVVRAELLRDTLRYYEAFTEQAADDPELQVDLAFAHFKTGQIHEQIGSRERAIAEYRKALDAFQRLCSGEEPVGDFRAELALCYNDLGLLLGKEGKTEEARAALNSALAIQQELADTSPGDARFPSDKALTLGNLGVVEHRAGNLTGAEKCFLTAQQIQSRLVEQYPDQLDYQSALAVTYNSLTVVYGATDVARAEEAYGKARAIQEKLTEARPQSIEYLGDLANTCDSFGKLQEQRGDVAGAIEAHHQAVEIRRRLLRRAPSVIQFRSDLAVGCSNLGRLYSHLGDHATAQLHLDEAIERFEQLVSDYPEEFKHRSSLGGAQNNRAWARQQLGRADEAEADYRAAIEQQRLAVEGDPGNALFRRRLNNHYRNLGELLKQQGRNEEAIEIMDVLGRMEAEGGVTPAGENQNQTAVRTQRQAT